jgi:hypothetical protein
MIIFLGFFIISMFSAINYTGCEKGRHTIKAYAQDIAGNINSTPEIVFYVDIQPPWIYLNTSVNGSNLTVNITYYDCAVYWNQAYSCCYNIDSGLNISLSNCSQAEITNISYGNHNITVYANDSAGNINSTTASFTYSSCFPSLTKEWIINCADQCLFNNPITYDGNISMVGVGSVILQSTLRLIQPWKIYKENGCVFRVENGGRIE